MRGTTRSGTARGSRMLAAGGALGIATGLTIAGVALSGPAHAAPSAQLAYSCAVPAIGLTFSDPWTVTVDTDYPTTVAAGAAISTSHFDASITAGDDAAEQFRALGFASWSGSVKFSYAVSGDVASAGDRSATLTVPQTTLPATGPVVTDATGTAADEEAGDTAGTATVTAADLTASVTTDSGVPVDIECSLAAGQDATVASVQVTAASSTSTPPTSTPPTSTSSSTSTPPATTSTTSVTTGPPIITDGADSGGSNDVVFAGLGVAILGGGLLTAGARRRMRDARK
ncbi:DUF6801 domain-containing protein [Flexivirga oryzae]|uniref:DUF6801 domain-containing protein n=1 Tax=Flexivirga oryzae TaxID=1794944 RepID=A0A839NBE9_9MICO|nr:DUF6801 domain-containing protein [Flexivirga oryzae]MBB2892956.1 hypothetical protein [Flexivirga oryzae]